MATLGVPGTYATVAAAVAAAAVGDTIVVAAGYAGNEAVSVTVDDLTFSAPAGVPGIVLTAAAGVARISLAGASAIRVDGNASNNDLVGNSGANVMIDGGGGDDTLGGGDGNDTLTVTGGVDAVDGGAGTDTLIVDYSAATSTVTASGGASSVVTDGGTRTVTYSAVEQLRITGGSGNDRLYGGDGSDTLAGGDGNDVLNGGKGIDVLRGGNGDDLLYAQGTGGTIDGGAGTDTIQSISEAIDLGSYTFTSVEILDGYWINGSIAQIASFATITYSPLPNTVIFFALRGAGGALDLSARLAAGYSASVYDDGLAGGVTIIGSSQTDTLNFTTSTYGETLDGGGGHDELIGGTAADVLNGGDGDDYIASGSGTDTLNGGNGNDLIVLKGPGGTVDGGAGIDSVRATDLGSYVFANVEILDTHQIYGTIAQLASFSTIAYSASTSSQIFFALQGAGGALDLSTRMATGYSASVYDNGLTGRVTLIGSGLDDYVSFSGSSYAETVNGEGGNDQLGGGNAADTMNGGAGNDVLYGSAGDVLIGGWGDDSLHGDGTGVTASYSDAAGGVKVSLATTGVQNTLSAGSDTLTGISNLVGSAFDDQLTGDSGKNVLSGGGGNDSLVGGDGNDTLAGGLGRDMMTGGNGADTFVFRNGDSPVALFDSITDFASGIDHIDLPSVASSGLPAAAYAETSVASSNFNDVLTAATALMAAGDKSAVFVAGSIDGWLFWNMDANPTTPEESVRLAGANTLAGFQAGDLK